MKFGKRLRDLLPSEYYEKSLNYKYLKKICKRFDQESEEENGHLLDHLSDYLAKQQQQIESFYFAREEQCHEICRRVQKQLLALAVENSGTGGQDEEKLHSEPPQSGEGQNSLVVISLMLERAHQRIDRLDQFVKLNRIAFRKITKKFNKSTGDFKAMLIFQKVLEKMPFMNGLRVERLKETADGYGLQAQQFGPFPDAAIAGSFLTNSLGLGVADSHVLKGQAIGRTRGGC